MTINYTALLGLAEPVTGTESGNWGDDVNLGLTSYLDIGIAGTNNITQDSDITLTITNGSSAGSNIVASPNSTTAQYMQLLCTGSRTANRNINAPNSSKMFVVNNSTTGGYSIVVRGATGPTTGVTIANGEKAIVFWSSVASDFVKISTSLISQMGGILSGTNGGTGVNNGSNTITLGGNLTTSGAYGTTLSVTNTTSVTLPTSGTLATLANAETFTNKRIDPRVSSTTSASSVTPTIASYDIYAFTAQAATLTINAPTGTPVDGDKLIFRILDNGTPQTLSWNATYTIIGVTLPTTTTANKTTYVGCIYNSNNTRWDVVAVTTQA